MSTETKQHAPDWREAEALRRFMLITPVLDDALDKAKRIRIRKTIAMQQGVSEKTLRRYEKKYHQGGFPALKPGVRATTYLGKVPDNFPELLQEAIQLRREVPSRSVDQIILILEMEGKAAPGVLKRSTLQRHLEKAGYSAAQMRLYEEARGTSSRRFCKPHRMMLIQGDIKYGLKLPIGPNGKKIQTYLSSAIDDHSRSILASEFYDNQEEAVVEDTFRKVILKYGAFDACYFDNGSQYIAKQLKLSLARLSIRISHAPIRSGKSKGKIEKFHQVADAFLKEAKTDKRIKTLSDLNHYWKIFLEEYYQKKAHDGIAEYYEALGVTIPEKGISPEQEFNRDTRPLLFLDAATVGEAFLHHETRKVDRGGCISFQGRKYETRASLIGNVVEIAYDPSAPELITVRYERMEPFTAKPLQIRPYCDQKPAVPASVEAAKPETSRFLTALEKKYTESMGKRADAISFGDYRKEAASNV